MGSFKNQLEKEMLLFLTPIFQNFQRLGHSSRIWGSGFNSLLCLMNLSPILLTP